MANKRQRKKAAKKAAKQLGIYEGQQYTGGRSPGRGNLAKTGGKIVNAQGVEFTLEDKRRLENAVNRANAHRRAVLKKTATMPRLINVTDPSTGKLVRKDTGDTVGSLQAMGAESDFILQRKSKSLQRFNTREEFDNYMKNLDRVNSKDYLVTRIRQYKANHIKAIRNVLQDEGIAMKIQMMPPEQYMAISAQFEDILEIHYVYGNDERLAKINQIRAALGMKIKEEPDMDSEFVDVED